MSIVAQSDAQTLTAELETKNKELKEFGEYRTQRLVLAAWDAGEN